MPGRISDLPAGGDDVLGLLNVRVPCGIAAELPPARHVALHQLHELRFFTSFTPATWKRSSRGGCRRISGGQVDDSLRRPFRPGWGWSRSRRKTATSSTVEKTEETALDELDVRGGGHARGGHDRDDDGPHDDDSRVVGEPEQGVTSTPAPTICGNEVEDGYHQGAYGRGELNPPVVELRVQPSVRM